MTSPADFNGQFVLSYTVSDGEDAVEAHATITVTPVNDAPEATPITVATGPDLPVAVDLVGTDVDGDTLTYEIVSEPSHGTLSGTAPALTYTPNAGFYGADVFSYRVRDAEAASAPVAVSVTVDVGAPPVVNPQSVVTLEDTATSITLTGSDPDGDSITFALRGLHQQRRAPSRSGWDGRIEPLRLRQPALIAGTAPARPGARSGRVASVRRGLRVTQELVHRAKLGGRSREGRRNPGPERPGAGE